MDIWNKVVGIQKIIDIFGEPITFHDGEVILIKYDGKNGSIQINCEGFIKTMCLFEEKYKSFADANIEFTFKNVALFQIDGGYGYIDELKLEELDNCFIFSIDSCGLKFVCESVEINQVYVITKQNQEHNRLLDSFLKSDL